MRALIVDDSRFARKYVRGLLEHDGVDCEEAVDGACGMERLRQGKRFDVILVDWNLSGISGLDLVKRIRQEGHREIKLMMVTVETQRHAIDSALNAGADEYLMKPFDDEALNEKLAMLGLAEV